MRRSRGATATAVSLASIVKPRDASKGGRFTRLLWTRTLRPPCGRDYGLFLFLPASVV